MKENLIKRQMRLKCAITKLLKEGYEEAEIKNMARGQSAKLALPEIEEVCSENRREVKER